MYTFNTNLKTQRYELGCCYPWLRPKIKTITPILKWGFFLSFFLCNGEDCGIPLDLIITYNADGLPEIN